MTMDFMLLREDDFQAMEGPETPPEKFSLLEREEAGDATEMGQKST